jgi:hypothetical protein
MVPLACDADSGSGQADSEAAPTVGVPDAPDALGRSSHLGGPGQAWAPATRPMTAARAATCIACRHPQDRTACCWFIGRLVLRQAN